MRGVRALVAVLLFLPSAARASPGDLPGWGAARWGMTVSQLDAAMPGLRRLEEPFLFSGARALRSTETEVGGVPMLVLFQTGDRSGGLQQVLLQTRRAVTPNLHRQVGEALLREYGPPDVTCVQAKAAGAPLLVEQVWRFPATTVHAIVFDFTTTSVVTSDPNAPRSQIDRPDQRNNWRGFPRRIVVRLHPAERRDLLGACGR